MRELLARALRACGLQATHQTSCNACCNTSPFACAVLAGTRVDSTIDIKEVAQPLALTKQYHVSHACAEVYCALRHQRHVRPLEQAIGIRVRQRITGNVRPKGRYDIESSELDAFVRDPNAPSTEPASLVRALNREQAFRVIPSGSDLTYAKRLFYRTGLDIAAIAKGREEGSPLEMLTPSPWLEQVASEKGGGTAAQWVENSVFGGMFAEFGLSKHGAPSTAKNRPLRILDPELFQEIQTFDTLVCDDGGQEQADFMCMGELPKRVVFVHAKVNSSQMSVSAMQIVGRQLASSPC